ncbi:MAG: hypothetical protein WAW75_00805 [Gallionella sp.]
MNPDSKIYIAGHRGLAGSAITRELQRQGYTNICRAVHEKGVGHRVLWSQSQSK